MDRNIKEVAQTWNQIPKNRRNTLWERGYNIEQLHQGTKEGPGTSSSSRVQGHWTWNSGWRNPVPQPTLPSSLKMQQHAADDLWTNHSSIQPHSIDHSATTPMKDLQCHAKRAILSLHHLQYWKPLRFSFTTPCWYTTENLGTLPHTLQQGTRALLLRNWMLVPTGNKYKNLQHTDVRSSLNSNKLTSMMALAASVNTGEMSRRSRLFTMNLSLSLIPYQNCSGINLHQTKRNGIP